MRPRAFSWIAVALATAICLLPQIQTIAASAAVAALAVLALILSGDHISRTAASLLIGVALIDLATFAATARVGSNFAQRSALHVDREVQRVRAEVATIESELDASAARVAEAIRKNAVLSRPQLFNLLRSQVRHTPGRGMRIVSNGNVLAWWGEDLRVSGSIT